jgi:hypothetical protein
VKVSAAVVAEEDERQSNESWALRERISLRSTKKKKEKKSAETTTARLLEIVAVANVREKKREKKRERDWWSRPPVN